MVLCHNGQDITGINGGRPFLLVNCVREYKEVVKFSGNSLVIFYFSDWHYNPLRVLAFSVILFHSALFLHCFLHSLIPIICISSSISTNVLFPLFAYLLRYQQPSYSRYLHIFFDIDNRLIPVICISSSISATVLFPLFAYRLRYLQSISYLVSL